MWSWVIVVIPITPIRWKRYVKPMSRYGACPSNASREEALPAEHALLNRMLASMRSIVEHPFRVVKRQFGYIKVRYRGLYKNGQQLCLLFALANLFKVRKSLMTTAG